MEGILTASVTPAELHAGALSQEKLEAVVRRFATDGVVVLLEVLPHAVLDNIATALDHAAAHYVASDKGYERGPQGGFPRDPDRPGLQICAGIPRQFPWVVPELVSNGVIEQVVQAVLGGDVFMRYFNCNSSCPGSGMQMVHADQQWDWCSRDEAKAAGEEWPHRTTRVFVNFGVDAMTPANGSTQLWPGTHAVEECATINVRYHEAEPDSARDTWDPRSRSFGQDPAVTALVDRQRQARPPVRLMVPKGAVAIRDNRCWHACCPNTSPWPRHMFGLGYSTTRAAEGRDFFSGDQNGKPTLVFADDRKAAFRSEISQRTVSFAPPGVPVDHYGNLPGGCRHLHSYLMFAPSSF